MKLDPFDSMLPMPNAHDNTISRLRRNFQAIGKRSALDDQGVITGRLKGRGQSPKHTFPVVLDLGNLPVHELAGAYDLASERFTDRLMAETNSEDGKPTGVA